MKIQKTYEFADLQSKDLFIGASGNGDPFIMLSDTYCKTQEIGTEQQEMILREFIRLTINGDKEI